MKKLTTFKRSYGLIILLTITVISLVLSVSGTDNNDGLGGLANLIWIPFVGLILSCLYILITWIIKKGKIRLGLIILFSMYILYIGIAFMLDKEEVWSFVIF